MKNEIVWLSIGILVGVVAIIDGRKGIKKDKLKNNRYYRMFSEQEIFGGILCIIGVIVYILIWFIKW